MKKTFLILLIITGCLFAQKADEHTLVKNGEKAPSFQVETIDGKSYNLEDLKGKVVMINFFATWCPPCQRELPILEQEVYKEIDNEDFVLLVIGREHDNEELKYFKEKKKLDLPFAPDQDRSIFSKYAKQNIPRNFLIDKDGKIVMNSVGFEREEFDQMVNKIKELVD